MINVISFLCSGEKRDAVKILLAKVVYDGRAPDVTHHEIS